MHSQTKLPHFFGTPPDPTPPTGDNRKGSADLGFGATWTHMDDVVREGCEERVAAAPLGSVTPAGERHFETTAQVARFGKRRAEIASSRIADATDILEIKQNAKRKKPRRSASAGPAAESDGPATAAGDRTEDDGFNLDDLDGEDADKPPTFFPEGVKMFEKLTSTPVTHNDVHKQIDLDAEAGLLWIPTPSPADRAEQRELGGPPNDHAYCFACAAGGPSVGIPQMDALANMWRDNRRYSSKSRLAKNVGEFYETRVRATNNRLVGTRTEQLLGEWSPASIKEHFTRHDRSPETWLTETLDQLEGMQHFLNTGGCYVMNTQDNSDVRMCKDRVMLYLNIVKTHAALAKLKPQEMIGYSPDRSSATTRGVPVINSRKNMGGMGPPASAAASAGSSSTGFVSSFL